MKKLIIIALVLIVGCKGKEPDVEYIISGSDTIAFTAYNGYSVDVSKAHGTHGYASKNKDSFFTVFINSMHERVDSVQLKDSVICVYYTIRKK